MDRNALLEAFASVIPPVQLFELLEMLMMLECVRKSEIKIANSVSQKVQANSFDDFFAIADSETFSISGPPSPLDVNGDSQPQTEIVYEASVDAFSRLSLFNDILKSQPTTNSADQLAHQQSTAV